MECLITTKAIDIDCKFKNLNIRVLHFSQLVDFMKIIIYFLKHITTMDNTVRGVKNYL